MRRDSRRVGSGGWVRVVALLAVVAMVASVGYSALVTVDAPTWLVFLLAALLLGLPIGLLARREHRS